MLARLDQRTFLSQERKGEKKGAFAGLRSVLSSMSIQRGYTVVKVRNYGKDGEEVLAEVSWSYVSPVRSKSGVGLPDREASVARAVRRAKAEVRRKVMAAGLNYLLTLTWRENMQDAAEADRAFRRFVVLVQRHIPGWKYVAVRERQKRGAWHWHVAVEGWQDVVLLRRLWREVVGDGNIDVSRSRRGKWKRSSLASYLAKYITKHCEVEFGKHRYRASRIVVPLVRRVIDGVVTVEDVIGILVREAGKVGYVWLSDGMGWCCSW